MPSALRVIVISIFLTACALPVSAQAAPGGNPAALNAPALSSDSAKRPTATQNDSPYMLKHGDTECGFGGGGAFTATRIFGGLREDEARDRGLVLAAFRYGRTLAANRNIALQYTLDAVPLDRKRT